MKIVTLEFYECEHNGDLDNYTSDIRSCGGRIIQSRVDTDDEVGVVRFEVDDYPKFMEAFKETDAFQFLN